MEPYETKEFHNNYIEGVILHVSYFFATASSCPTLIEETKSINAASFWNIGDSDFAKKSWNSTPYGCIVILQC